MSYPRWSSLRGEVFPLSAILVCQSQHQSLGTPTPEVPVFSLFMISLVSVVFYGTQRPRELTVQSLK